MKALAFYVIVKSLLTFVWSCTYLAHIEYLLVLFHDGQVDGATAGSHLEISELFIFIYTSMILSYIDQLVDFAASIDQLLGNICVGLEYIGIFVCVCL